MKIRVKVLALSVVFILTLTVLKVRAQVVQLQPSQVTLQDSVTILYNATLGNGALNNFQGNVYLHTGLITPQSTSPNKGQSDPNCLSLEMEGGPARYWYIPGTSYKNVLEQMTGLTGRQELPPRWALGKPFMGLYPLPHPGFHDQYLA